MLDIKYIRKNKEKVIKAIKDKQLAGTVDIEKLLQIDREYVALLQKVETHRALKNTLSENISKLAADKDARQKVIDEATKLKEEMAKDEAKLKELKAKFDEMILLIPNPPEDDVKPGKDDTENDVEKTWGKPTKFDFEPKDHLELGEHLEIIDVKSAAAVSGARFAYLKGDAVRLELALVNYAMNVLGSEGFVPVVPPTLIKKDSMRAMGYLEHGGEEDMFVLDKDNLVLVGTSEQSIGPMHMNKVLDAKSLPLRFAGFSSCFRREAGSYGKDTRGILRVHQFDKIEMFSFSHPKEGNKEHEFLLSLEEKLFQALEIPYQVVKMCTGDLGMPASRKYDIEAWIPSQNKYREVTSTSTTTDFQSRRLNIKYKENGTTDYVHTLNGTAFAIGRTIIAILENNQQKDGSVKIPKVLQPYMNGQKLIESK